MINLSQETEALAQRLAVAQNVSVEQAIRLALEKQANDEGITLKSQRRRDQSLSAIAARRARTDRVIAGLAAMPVLDPRSPCEIMDDLNAL